MVLTYTDIIMKQLLSLLLLSLTLMFAACGDEPEPGAKQLPLLKVDSSALVNISEMLHTDAEDYPMRWTPADRSTWKDIRLDTVVDEATGQKYLTVAALTIYQIRKEIETPPVIGNLSNLKELKIYGCAGAVICPYVADFYVEKLLVDRMNPDDDGLMKLSNGKILHFPYNRFTSLTIHGTDAEYFYIEGNRACVYDLSGNNLKGDIPYYLSQYPDVNLSHNKFSGLEKGWNKWIKDAPYFPCAQYNDIEIPDEIMEDSRWQTYLHEKFIGNPGYRAPAD